MKITFEKILEIDELYGKLLKIDGFENTKLGYAFKKFTSKNTSIIVGDYNDVLQDIRISNALTDKNTGAILYSPDQRNYQYTPENLKTVIKLIKETTQEWNTKEFEVKPFICEEIPATVQLTDEEKDLIKGIIIN